MIFIQFGNHSVPYTGDIYLGDAIDQVQRGIVYRYKSDGTAIDTFKTGINPGFFYSKSKALMTDHRLKAKDLLEIVGLSKGTISKILNYHAGLSRQTIRKLSAYFKISQEAFNRLFTLKNEQYPYLERLFISIVIYANNLNNWVIDEVTELGKEPFI